MIRPEYIREQDIPLGHSLEEIANAAEHWCYFNGRLVPITSLPESAHDFFRVWEVLPYVPEGERATMRIREVDLNGIFQSCAYGQLTYMGEKTRMFTLMAGAKCEKVLSSFASIGTLNRVEVITVANRNPCVRAFQRFITHELGMLVIEQGVGIDGSGNIRFFKDRPSNDALSFGKRALAYRKSYLDGDVNFDLEQIVRDELFIHKTALEVDL